MTHRFRTAARALLAVILLMAEACSPRSVLPGNSSWSKAERVLAAFHDPASKYVIVVSHRGDWRNHPENSIPAIESVIRMGVDMMELDVKRTRDGVLVLCHDQTLDRTTTGHGRISDYTYKELLAFDLKTGHGIARPGVKMPTLRQAMEVCRDRILINVDHAYDYYDEVLALAEELGVAGQVLIKSGRPYGEVQVKLSQHSGRLLYMPVISAAPPEKMTVFNGYLAAPESQPAYELCFDKLDGDTRAAAGKIIASGSKLWVNTIWASLCGGHDDDAAYGSPDPDTVYGPVLELGTSIIQTDRPEFLIRYLENKKRR